MNVVSQWHNSSDDVSPYPKGARIDAGALYIGGFSRLSVESPMMTVKYRILSNNNRNKEVLVQKLFNPGILFAMKPNGYSAAALDASWLWRRKNERGVFLEYGLGIGLGYFNGKDSFLNSYHGKVPKNIYFLPSGFVGFGSDLLMSSNAKIPWLWSIKLYAPCAYPVNKKLYPLPMLMLSLVRYFPDKWMGEQRYVTYSRTRPW